MCPELQHLITPLFYCFTLKDFLCYFPSIIGMYKRRTTKNIRGRTKNILQVRVANEKCFLLWGNVSRILQSCFGHAAWQWAVLTHVKKATKRSICLEFYWFVVCQPCYSRCWNELQPGKEENYRPTHTCQLRFFFSGPFSDIHLLSLFNLSLSSGLLMRGGKKWKPSTFIPS